MTTSLCVGWSEWRIRAISEGSTAKDCGWSSSIGRGATWNQAVPPIPHRALASSRLARWTPQTVPSPIGCGAEAP
eukprot:scaffold13829_cov35-Tisochrysis_lutea.AAC.4